MGFFEGFCLFLRVLKRECHPTFLKEFFMSDEILFVTMHEFKQNMSRYISELREGKYGCIILKRYKRKMCLITDPGRRSRP
jgi:hypothetical protein